MDSTDLLDDLYFNYALYALICYDHDLKILSALCLIISGSLISFLVQYKTSSFNMGDLGSLSLWATLAVIAMMTDTLVVLHQWSHLLAGTCFCYYPTSFRKNFEMEKVFRIAPFHHHLEAIGLCEENIVMRFWIIGMILAVLGLSDKSTYIVLLNNIFIISKYKNCSECILAL